MCRLPRTQALSVNPLAAYVKKTCLLVGIGEECRHPGWIPFAANWTGDHLFIDLAPGSGGTAGQIISMDHEENTHHLIASSLSAFFKLVVEALGSKGAGPVWPFKQG